MRMIERNIVKRLRERQTEKNRWIERRIVREGDRAKEIDREEHGKEIDVEKDSGKQGEGEPW